MKYKHEEKKMLDLIVEAARDDQRIRAVYLTGSRANPKAKKDHYQDYDIVYVVTETTSFLSDRSWIDDFGTPLITQEPDWNDSHSDFFGGEAHDESRRYVWLMLFDDGSRIDLTIEVLVEALKSFSNDGMAVTLLDKDQILPEEPAASDHKFYIRPPEQDAYHVCCNEFWWCLNNVAKGIARDELPYVMEMFNRYVRDMMRQMIEWYIGIHHRFAVTAGKGGKHFKKYLPSDIYDRYAATYTGSDYQEIWTAVMTMCDLFHDLALETGDYFQYSYRMEEEEGMRKYLEMVRDEIESRD